MRKGPLLLIGMLLLLCGCGKNADPAPGAEDPASAFAGSVSDPVASAAGTGQTSGQASAADPQSPAASAGTQTSAGGTASQGAASQTAPAGGAAKAANKAAVDQTLDGILRQLGELDQLYTGMDDASDQQLTQD